MRPPRWLSPTPEAQARWVTSALRSQGYPRLAQLPADGAQGSRELLLALSWLLAGGRLLERLLAQTRVRLGDEMPVCEVGVGEAATVGAAGQTPRTALLGPRCDPGCPGGDTRARPIRASLSWTPGPHPFSRALAPWGLHSCHSQGRPFSFTFWGLLCGVGAGLSPCPPPV